MRSNSPDLPVASLRWLTSRPRRKLATFVAMSSAPSAIGFQSKTGAGDGDGVALLVDDRKHHEHLVIGQQRLDLGGLHRQWVRQRGIVRKFNRERLLQRRSLDADGGKPGLVAALGRGIALRCRAG